jgi:hypothetical protein
MCSTDAHLKNDITPCSPVKVNRSFEGTCRLRLQIWRVRQVRKQHEAGSKQSFTYHFSYCAAHPFWNSWKDQFQFDSWSWNSFGTVISSYPFVLLYIWPSQNYVFAVKYFCERWEPQGTFWPSRGITSARTFRSVWYNHRGNGECLLSTLWHEAGSKQFPRNVGWLSPIYRTR